MRSDPTVINLLGWLTLYKLVKKDHSGNLVFSLLSIFNFQCVINNKTYRSLQRFLISSCLHLKHYIVNIHTISISFVLSATKSAWFYLRNYSSAISDMKDIKRISYINPLFLKIKRNSLIKVITERTSQTFGISKSCVLAAPFCWEETRLEGAHANLKEKVIKQKDTQRLWPTSVPGCD